MNTRRLVGWIGFAAFAVSWFLPVLRPSTYFEHFPGWRAFWEALTLGMSSLWPLTNFRPTAVFQIASALTNAAMVMALVATLRGKELGRRWGWYLIGAGVLNVWWVPLLNEESRTFGVGYVLWVLAWFAVGWSLLGAKAAPAAPVRGSIP